MNKKCSNCGKDWTEYLKSRLEPPLGLLPAHKTITIKCDCGEPVTYTDNRSKEAQYLLNEKGELYIKIGESEGVE